MLAKQGKEHLRATEPSALDDAAGEQAPAVTVLIPARNEAASIAGCLDSVLSQDYPNLEVIVVDGSSIDETPDIVLRVAGRDSRVRLLRNERASIPISLNLGLEAAKGEYLVRVDAHSTISPGYVREAVSLLRLGGWGGVGGRKEAVGRTPAGHAIAEALGSRFGVGDSHYHHATEARTVDHVPFGVYPVALCRSLGGWNEQLTTNEDYEFDYRVRQAGWELYLDPRLRIDWLARQSIPDLFKQYRRYGAGKAGVARLHPQSLKARHLAAPALVAWLAGLAALALVRPRAAAVLGTPYVGALTVASVLTAARIEEPRARRYVPAAFVTMHVAWGLGFWSGLLRRR
jgi:succinoglycan biosynthesis protein ExoA